MAKIPETALKDIPQKCQLCGVKFKNKATLVAHIGKKHDTQVPKDWSPARYENYIRTGKDHGSCIVCKKETGWNESTWKYNRLCDNEECRKVIADRAEANCKKALGKGRKELLNDPEFQRKMIYSKKNSGKYEWSSEEGEKCENLYDSQVSKSFLEMLDVFLNFDPRDVFSPSPNTYPYKYEGKVHQYIPDHYIASLNLEVEIKEPKDNQNMHPKIQAVDKVKEKIKDETMAKRSDVYYIKINGNDYSEFFSLLKYLKDKEDKVINRSVGDHYVIRESIFENPDDLISVLERKSTKLSEYDKISLMLSTTMDITNPNFTYKKTLDRLERRIDSCNTLDECDRLQDEMKKIQEELKNQQKVERGNGRMRYEAEKAYDKIDERLLPKLEVHRSRIEHRPITEASVIKCIRKDKVFYPVFIFLSYAGTNPFGRAIKRITQQDFSHASFTTDTTLRNMVSFGTRSDGGMGFVPDESITNKGYASSEHGYYSLYMYMANQQEYDVINGVVNEFKSKDRNYYKYSWRGVGNILFGKESHYETEYFCSEFVATVISTANPNLINRDPSLYTPGDLAELDKFTEVSHGLLREYDEKATDRTIRQLLKRRGFTNVQMD